MTEAGYVRDDKGKFVPGSQSPTTIRTSERAREIVKKRWDEHFERAAVTALEELNKRGLDVGPSNAPANARVFGVFFSLLTQRLFGVLQKEDMTAAELRDLQRMSEFWLKNLSLHPDQEVSSAGKVSVKTEGQTVVLITPETTRALELLQNRRGPVDDNVVDAELSGDDDRGQD